MDNGRAFHCFGLSVLLSNHNYTVILGFRCFLRTVITALVGEIKKQFTDGPQNPSYTNGKLSGMILLTEYIEY